MTIDNDDSGVGTAPDGAKVAHHLSPPAVWGKNIQNPLTIAAPPINDLLEGEKKKKSSNKEETAP